MHKTLASILLLLFIFYSAPNALAQSSDSTPATQQVIQFMRDRKHAYEQADSSAWGAHVAENCSFLEDGGRLSKKSAFAALEHFVGYHLSTEITDIQPTDYGDTILLTYRQKETRDFGTQRATATYLDTETYTRIHGEWQLILFTENLLPPEPRTIKLATQLYPAYVGTYAANAQATFTVTLEHRQLFGQYPGEEKFPLFPASKSQFFTPGDSTQYLFVWNKSNHITAHIYRSSPGTEIKYQKREIPK